MQWSIEMLSFLLTNYVFIRIFTNYIVTFVNHYKAMALKRKFIVGKYFTLPSYYCLNTACVTTLRCTFNIKCQDLASGTGSVFEKLKWFRISFDNNIQNFWRVQVLSSLEQYRFLGSSILTEMHFSWNFRRKRDYFVYSGPRLCSSMLIRWTLAALYHLKSSTTVFGTGVDYQYKTRNCHYLMNETSCRNYCTIYCLHQLSWTSSLNHFGAGCKLLFKFFKWLSGYFTWAHGNSLKRFVVLYIDSIL